MGTTVFVTCSWDINLGKLVLYIYCKCRCHGRCHHGRMQSDRAEQHRLQPRVRGGVRAGNNAFEMGDPRVGLGHEVFHSAGVQRTLCDRKIHILGLFSHVMLSIIH